MNTFERRLVGSIAAVAGGLGAFTVGSNTIDRHTAQQADCIIAKLPRADEKRCQRKIDPNFEDTLLEAGGAGLAAIGLLGIAGAVLGSESSTQTRPEELPQGFES